MQSRLPVGCQAGANAGRGTKIVAPLRSYVVFPAHLMRICCARMVAAGLPLFERHPGAPPCWLCPYAFRLMRTDSGKDTAVLTPVLRPFSIYWRLSRTICLSHRIFDDAAAKLGRFSSAKPVQPVGRSARECGECKPPRAPCLALPCVTPVANVRTIPIPDGVFELDIVAVCSL